MRAWYSKKMAHFMASMPWCDPNQRPACLAVYARADGSEVFVTAVTPDAKHSMGWDDVEDLGEVSHFLRAATSEEFARVQFERPPAGGEREA